MTAELVHDRDGLQTVCEADPTEIPESPLDKGYVENARLVASLPEPEAVRRFMPDPDDPRLVDLRRFLETVFVGRDGGEPLVFFPKMRPHIRELHRHEVGSPDFPERLFGHETSGYSPTPFGVDWMPHQFFGNHISCSAGTAGEYRSLRRTMAKLSLLNAMGYDIYACANPLVYKHRAQKTIRKIFFLVAEFDDASVDEQVAGFKKLSAYAAALVYSGGKSCHMYVRLRRPIWNRYAARFEDWRDFQRQRRDGLLKGGVNLTIYLDHADLLRGHIYEQTGLHPDLAVLNNFASLTRVPGFRHCGTGNVAKLLHADTTAACPELEPLIDDARYLAWGREQLGLAVNDVYPSRSKANPDAATVSSEVAPDAPTICHAAQGEANTPATMSCQPDGDGDALEAQPDCTTSTTINGLEATERQKKQAPHTDHTKDTTASPPSPPSQTFLDDLDEFVSLRRTGIPARHQRRRLHRVAINAARLLGWVQRQPHASGDGGERPRDTPVIDDVRAAREWAAILRATASGCVDGDCEENLADFRSHLAAVNASGKAGCFRHRLPDCTRLRSLTPTDARRLRARIVDMVAAGVLTPPVGGTAKTVASGAARVICEILWDHIRCRPAQCVGGTISIPARLIQDHCPGRRDAAVKRWMFANNIMRITRGYVVGKLTYLYWVNIPLVVWLLGFRKGELAWTRHASGGRTRPHDANDNAETGEAVERQTEEYMNHDHCDIGGCPRQPLGTPCDYCRHYSAAWVPKVMRASGEDGVDWARRQPAMPAVGLHELGTVEDLPPDIF